MERASASPFDTCRMAPTRIDSFGAQGVEFVMRASQVPRTLMLPRPPYDRPPRSKPHSGFSGAPTFLWRIGEPLYPKPRCDSETAQVSLTRRGPHHPGPAAAGSKRRGCDWLVLPGKADADRDR